MKGSGRLAVPGELFVQGLLNILSKIDKTLRDLLAFQLRHQQIEFVPHDPTGAVALPGIELAAFSDIRFSALRAVWTASCLNFSPYLRYVKRLAWDHRTHSPAMGHGGSELEAPKGRKQGLLPL